jgi:hypothetical protein
MFVIAVTVAVYTDRRLPLHGISRWRGEDLSEGRGKASQQIISTFGLPIGLACRTHTNIHLRRNTQETTTVFTSHPHSI